MRKACHIICNKKMKNYPRVQKKYNYCIAKIMKITSNH